MDEHPPLVECEDDQVTISDTYWFWLGSPNHGSGLGRMSPDGTNWETENSRGRTYSYTWEGWLYLAAVQDAFSRRDRGLVDG